MKTIDLRKKWIQSIRNVDDRFLKMIDDLYKSYAKDETDFFDELPKEIQDLLLESVQQSKSGEVFTHESVVAEFKQWS